VTILTKGRGTSISLDVHVGTVGERSGVPVGVDQWQRPCGFYPGCEPGEFSDGSRPDFFTACREFEIAWRVLSAKKTESDYREWRAISGISPLENTL